MATCPTASVPVRPNNGLIPTSTQEFTNAGGLSTETPIALFIDDATLIPPTVLAVVYPAMDGRRQIIIKANGGETTDVQSHQYPDIPAQHVIASSTAPILDAHNWTNPADATDRRFTYEIHTPEQCLHNIETKRHRGPGTLTVIDTDKTDWSWR